MLIDDPALPSIVHTWLNARGVRDLSPFEPWLASMRLTQLVRDDFLVRAGDHSDRLYLVHRGLLRLFYVTEDGRERNKAFFDNGYITGAVSAAFTGGPAPFSIQALADSILVETDYRRFAENAHEHPETSRLLAQLLSEAFIRNEEREALLLTRNAEQRYQWLLDHEHDLLARIPQFHIASYLGVDAVSLSRIRRKLRVETQDAAEAD